MFNHQHLSNISGCSKRTVRFQANISSCHDTNNQELLNEAEQDIGIIQIEASVICRSEAEADNADRGLNNSDILRKPNSIILLLFILQEKSAM